MAIRRRVRKPSRVSGEATVTSKGQITLPKGIREHLGIETGTRIRFSLDDRGGLQAEPVLYDLEDLWAAADSGPRPRRVMTFAAMDAAKSRRQW
jgi:AbrB family looped-hinge helix DNA binding protein